jgi:hypothetical protein
MYILLQNNANYCHIYVHNTSDQDLSAMYQFLSVADMADKEDIAPCLVTDLAMYHKYMDLFLAPYIYWHV